MIRSDIEANVRSFILIVLALAWTASAARAQAPAPAVGQSAPLSAVSSPTEAPASPTAGPSGTAFGQAAPIATGASQNAPAPHGIAAPSAAPPVGVSVRLGSFSDLLAAGNAVSGIGLTRSPGLTITPSVTLQEELTTNALGAATGRQTDLITTITPGILVNLQTPSAVGTLNYSPSAQIYATQSSQDNIAQNLNGSVSAVLLPQTLFLSLSAFATEQSTSGGLVPGGINVISPHDRTTSTSFMVNPSFMHRFGDIGTLRIGYSLSETSNSGDDAFVPSSTSPFFMPSYAVTNQGTASFTTGSFLGRFNDIVAATGARSTGTGVLDGAHQYVLTDTLRFALLRRFYIFGTFGHEDILYTSVPPVEINDAVWAGGVTLTPRPDTTITLGYGHFEGVNAPFVRAVIGLSPRTTLAVSYSDLLGTSLQLLQSAIANSIVNPAGTPVDTQSGVPVLLTNQLLSVQSSVFRNQLFSATLISTWPRDVYSLSIIDQKQKLIANAAGGAGFSQSSVSAGFGWTHLLSPSLISTAYLQVGKTTSLAVGAESTPTFAGQLSLLYRMTPTLTGTATLQLTNQWLNGGSTTLQTAAIVALHKVF